MLKILPWISFLAHHLLPSPEDDRDGDPSIVSEPPATLLLLLVSLAWPFLGEPTQSYAFLFSKD